MEKILASDAYIEDGFFHLHRHRLLLQRPASPEAIDDSRYDYETLRLEMSDLAQADNYWDILSYRDRWLSIADLMRVFYFCDLVEVFNGQINDECTRELYERWAGSKFCWGSGIPSGSINSCIEKEGSFRKFLISICVTMAKSNRLSIR